MISPDAFVILREGRKQMSRQEYWLSFKILMSAWDEISLYCEMYK